jgi:Uma2 family endonuclease
LEGSVAVAKKQMTLEEFLALPEEKPALELEDGVIARKVASDIWHRALQAELVSFIEGYLRPLDTQMLCDALRD